MIRTFPKIIEFFTFKLEWNTQIRILSGALKAIAAILWLHSPLFLMYLMWGAKASWTSTQVRFCGYTHLYFWCIWCEEPKLAELVHRYDSVATLTFTFDVFDVRIQTSWTSTQVRFCGYTNLYFWCVWCEEPKLAEQNQGHIPGSEIHNGLKLNIVLENVFDKYLFL